MPAVIITGISSIGDRAAKLAADAEELGRARPVEQDAEVGDVAVGADLLALDDDRADELVEGRIRQVRRFGHRPLVRFRPKRLEALALGDPPACVARRLRILAADIDLDAGDLERPGAVDRRMPRSPISICA